MSFVRVKNKGILWCPKEVLAPALAKQQELQKAAEAAKESKNNA
jgi:hypothetical protein